MKYLKRRTVGPEFRALATGISAGILSFVAMAPLALGQAAGTSAAAAPTTQAPKTATSEDGTISTTVDEVTLDLVIHDKHQKPILDANAADFTITDENTPVKLNGFHLINKDASNGHMVTLVFDHFDGQMSKATFNLATKVLKMIPTNGYNFAVLDLTGRLRLIQSFTADRNAITEAVRVINEKPQKSVGPLVLGATGIVVNNTKDPADEDRAKAAEKAEKELIAIVRTGADSTGNHVDRLVRAEDETLLAAINDSQLIRQDQHTLPRLAGLMALAKSQQKSPERKSLIYFTQNMQLDSAAKEMVKTITGVANRSGVNIYIVDMNALNTGTQYAVDTALGKSNIAFNPAPQAVMGSGGKETSAPTMQQGGMAEPTSNVGRALDWTRADPHQFTETKSSPMAELAKNTGGAYIDAQDNPGKPLQQMLSDMQTYYQASYIPPIQDYDGSFRNIAVKPARAGMNIRTKTGYFAIRPGAEGGIRPFEAPLLKILAQDELPSDVKYHASVLQFGDLANGNTSTVAIEVPLAAIQTKKDMNTSLFAAHVSVVAQIKDEKGTVVEHFGEDVNRRGALESFDSDKTAAITFQRHFMSIPGKYVLETAVMDQFGQKAGAQRVKFDIPKVAVTPSLSDMVLVRKMESFHEDDDAQEPMRYEKGKITPNLTGQLPEGVKSVSMFFILHPDPNAATPATLEMEIMRNGMPGHRTPLPLPTRSSLSSDAIPYLANFKASAIAPGNYEVKTRLTQGGKTSERALFFTVPGSDAVATVAATAVADLGLQKESTDPHAASQLVITSITDPVPPPTAAEIESIIADARKRAVGYMDSLPNFLCVEFTTRSIDTNGNGQWKLRDTLAELLRFRDKIETRTMLEVNGHASTVDRDSMKGQFSSGQFGGVLRAVFEPFAHAELTWKETDSLGNGTVQVFAYKVAKEHSMFSVGGANGLEVKPAYHGLVFIDSATRSVRRITLQTDGLPKDFPTQWSALAVDYDYIVINSHDYLMPVAAEFRQKQLHKMETLNTIEFRDYRRFSSTVKILGYTPLEKP